jgi:MFS transporter, CP family, cyanate transporter
VEQDDRALAPARHRFSAGRTLALLGIILVAVNLRTAVAALSPIVSQVSVDVPLGTLALSVLATLPPVCFAVAGIVTPMFARRLGLEVFLIVAIVSMVIGHLARGFSGSLGIFVAGSVVVFLGLGAGNVLLPPLVKKYFPGRIGLITSLYVTIVAISTFVPPLVAVPVADAAGWRVSLGLWAVMAFVALVPWIAILARLRVSNLASALVEEAEPALRGLIWRSPVAWAITIVFAVSSTNVYAIFAWMPQLLIDTGGATPGEAGALLALYAAMGVPTALLVPLLAARMKNPGWLVYLGAALLAVADLGLLLSPATATWVWVCLAGLGALFFPLALVMINLRTRSHEGSVALSGFVQSAGYILAVIGPLLFGLLHELTGGWAWSILLLLATGLAATVAGAVISRPHMLEDDLDRIRRRVRGT